MTYAQSSQHLRLESERETGLVIFSTRHHTVQYFRILYNNITLLSSHINSILYHTTSILCNVPATDTDEPRTNNRKRELIDPSVGC
jgi:hypothetical protein